ncbi:hypothetical protein COLO4_22386 [Corchorus olitorius]|uniref:Protein kinase domain-containing protein n=1 Tax=Corchorus olitorius TaxID=93759 RepID=A0A1R3IM85_9ROSI|nr:hypothetical protein COLO4_22386 [Corchorus olitorius]
MGSCFRIERLNKDEGFWLKNGGMLLEKLIASCNGKCNPIRMYSSEELRKATNDYNDGQEISRYVHFVLYKGFLHDREISVKWYKSSHSHSLETAMTDIVISSQMSVHKNVLKLIGCCLETQSPILVYEFGGEQNLKNYMSDIGKGQAEQLTWKSRKKIAIDIANAVAYLHTALPRPVIHRGLSLVSMVIDTDYVAKLADFSLSVTIPEGKSHVVEDCITGITGYMAPEVLKFKINEKADVYSFGIVLLELVTRRKSDQLEEATLQEFVWDHVENNRITEIVDQNILIEGINYEELASFIKIALHCTQENPEDRPTITDVAKQLRQLEL